MSGRSGLAMRLEEKPTLADENCLQGISFAGKSFYLDLPTNRQTQLLTKAICRLDGVIESFLSRDVDYVVTGSRKTVSSTSGSPVVTNKAEPPKCLVSAKIQTVHCSRGKQLLKKVIHSQEYSSVLTSARSWGVSVLYVDEVWAYLENLERPSAQTHPGTRTKGRNSTVPPLRIAILRSPFIKIEDQSRKFCPLKCTFTSFPEFSFMSSDRSPFENTQTANGLYKEKEPREQEEDERQQSQKPQLKKRKGYCECCEETFDVLCEHLVGKRHIQFISDTLNYKIIDDIALRLTCDLLEPPCRSLHNLKADHATSDPNNLNSNNLLVDTRDKGQNQDVLCTDGVDKVLCIQNKDEREIPLQHGDEVSNGTAKDLYEISINSAQTAKKPCNVPSGKMLNLTVGNDSDLQPDNVKSPSKLRKGTISDHQVLQTDCDRDGSQLSLDCVDVQGPINTEQHHRLVTEQMLIAVAEPKSCHSSGYGAKDQCSLVKDLLSQGGDLHKDVQVDETAPIPDLDQLLRSSSGKLSLEQTIGDTTTDKLSRLPLKDKLEEPCVELQKPTTHLNRTDDELNSLLRSSTSIFHEKLSRESHLLPPEQLETSTNFLSFTTVCCTETQRSTSLFSSTQTKLALAGAESELTCTNHSRGKRKHCDSLVLPQAKRHMGADRSSISQLPLWMICPFSNYGQEMQLPIWTDFSTWDGTVVTDEKSLDCSSSSTIPKLHQDSFSSESDWDAQLSSFLQKNPRHTSQYGELRMAQVTLNDSWYGKQLCNILTHDS